MAAKPSGTQHVVIGAGIAGVCCVEELCRLRPRDRVTLVSASTVLKGVDSVLRLSRTVEEVTIVEKDLAALARSNLTVLRGVVTGIDLQARAVHVDSQAQPLRYDRLCIAAGARPKVLPGIRHERIITLRDTQSVEDFARKLTAARRIAVVGNGGIALELIGAVRDVEVVWLLKHGHIGDAFFDLDAAQFLLGVLQAQQRQAAAAAAPQQQPRGQPEQQAGLAGLAGPPQQPGPRCQPATIEGHAAGPKWVHQLPAGRLPPNVRLERNALVIGASSAPQQQQQQQQQAAGGGSWPLYLQLSSGSEVGVDLVVQAIGVEPATDWLPAELARAPDGGILVGPDLQALAPGVYAAGDCCTLDPAATLPHWFQMRLWTQARLMGLHAAAGMAGADEREVLSFSFELFTHVTRFLGKKVVLLGLYNGQKLAAEPQGDVALYSRALDEDDPEAATFVRVLLLRGRMQGAVLIGDTDLEETFENLILDGLDLSGYGPALLDPEVELDHIFD